MEFTKYDTFGDYHWQEYEGLNSKEPEFAYKKHVDFVVGWVKEKDGLDIGCGDGLITSKLSFRGIDTSIKGIELAKQHGVQAEVGDVYNLGDRKESVVYLGDTLEHLEHPDMAIEEIGRITNLTYIATPHSEDGVVEEFGYTAWNPDKLTDFMKQHGWEELSREVINKVIYGKYKKA